MYSNSMFNVQYTLNTHYTSIKSNLYTFIIKQIKSTFFFFFSHSEFEVLVLALVTYFNTMKKMNTNSKSSFIIHKCQWQTNENHIQIHFVLNSLSLLDSLFVIENGLVYSRIDDMATGDIVTINWTMLTLAK